MTVTAIGALLLMVAHSQPAWVDGRIGPGLFAQWLAAGVTVLGLAMTGVAFLAPGGSRLPISHTNLATGLTVLAGVALFAGFARETGLVAGCAIAAALTGWAAGERTFATVARAGAIGAGAALAIGLSLLPSGAPLWP
jgi:hypothetical protein